MSGLFKKISETLARLNNRNPNLKQKSTIDAINKKCNELFENIYTRCRIEFGRELLELMDIKRHVAEKCLTEETCTPVQEMLAKKIIELIVLYFNLADSLVAMKKIDSTDKMAGDYINLTKDKMLKIQELVKTLNNQFYIKSEDLTSQERCDDLINEAEALKNVINQSIIKDYRDKNYE